MANVGQSVFWEVWVHSGDESSKHLKTAANVLRAIEKLIEGRRRQVSSLEQVGMGTMAEGFLPRHCVGPVCDGSEERVLPVGLQRGQPKRD